MGEYAHILAGLPVMYLIVVVAMLVIIIAMAMDAVFGWRKATLRGEAKTSYLFSRSITKFTLYEGVLTIACGIDTLIHFVWAMFIKSIIYCVPVVTCIAAIVLCVVEIWSMKEKADEKTRHNFSQAAKIVGETLSSLPREQVMDIAKHIIDKTASKDETETD